MELVLVPSLQFFPDSLRKRRGTASSHPQGLQPHEGPSSQGTCIPKGMPPGALMGPRQSPCFSFCVPAPPGLAVCGEADPSPADPEIKVNTVPLAPEADPEASEGNIPDSSILH